MAIPTDPLEPCARFYDADYRDQSRDVQLVVDLAQEFGDQILELGCGSGRLLTALAATGLSTVGVDLSPAMLARARARLASFHPRDRVKLVEADLRSFRLQTTNFDFACCVANSLMHLTTQQEQIQMLERAAAHLRTGGHLLLDLFHPDVAYFMQISGLRELADRWRDEEVGCDVFKWSVRTFDLAHQIQDTLFLYEELFEDGHSRQTACRFRLRYLWFGELTLMLHVAGFEVVEAWGDYDGGPYDDDSERLILLAKQS